jgi:hypothetical protein
MARAGSGAIACGIRERWHVDKRPYPQSALGGSDSTRSAWRAVTIETTITALDLPPLPASRCCANWGPDTKVLSVSGSFERMVNIRRPAVRTAPATASAGQA